MAKRLYEVTVEYTYYAYSDTPQAAERQAIEALRDMGADGAATAWPVKTKNHPTYWGHEELVYHDGQHDMTLGEALAELPEAAPKTEG